MHTVSIAYCISMVWGIIYSYRSQSYKCRIIIIHHGFSLDSFLRKGGALWLPPHHLALTVHRHEQQYPNRPTSPQMDSQQKAAISLRRGTKHLLSQMGVARSPGEMRGPLRGERPSFSGSKTVSVLCEQWRPSSVLAALISQPVQAGAKLIWESSMRGRNMGTHRRREVMRSRWVYTLGFIQCVALCLLTQESYTLLSSEDKQTSTGLCLVKLLVSSNFNSYSICT